MSCATWVVVSEVIIRSFKVEGMLLSTGTSRRCLPFAHSTPFCTSDLNLLCTIHTGEAGTHALYLGTILGCTYNFDIFKATYAWIDKRLYDILCMFDYPGFMVNQDYIMPYEDVSAL